MSKRDARSGSTRTLDVVRSVRLDRDKIASIDTLAAAFSTEGHEISRSAMLRRLILQGLDEVESQARP